MVNTNKPYKYWYLKDKTFSILFKRGQPFLFVKNKFEARSQEVTSQSPAIQSMLGKTIKAYDKGYNWKNHLKQS